MPTVTIGESDLAYEQTGVVRIFSGSPGWRQRGVVAAVADAGLRRRLSQHHIREPRRRRYRLLGRAALDEAEIRKILEQRHA